MKINLALLSPNQNAYSETFIQNHKKYLDANVKFYYGGYLPLYLEGEARLGLNKKERIARYINKKIFGKALVNTDQEKALINSFRKHKIDAVYVEYGFTGAHVAKVCKQMNLPLIVNFHGFDASIISLLDEYKEAYKNMFEYASAIIAVSKIMKQKLVELGCNAQKIVWTPCAPSESFFDIEPTYSENTFFSVGRFTDKKAPYYTILAFKKVVEKYSDAKLYMAGDGALLNVCINLVNYLNLNNNVVFLGAINQELLITYYTKIKAFIQHSITALDGDMEGTPVAVLEASAAGLPVISTKHAGIPDVIINGETGLLVEEHDVEGMANNMIRVLEDIDYAKKLGEAGRKNILENFSMDKHISTLNNVIRNSVKH